MNPVRALLLLLYAGCAQPVSPPAAPAIQAAFTVQSAGRAYARVITSAAACPELTVEGAAGAVPMTVRALPAVVPPRDAGAQTGGKPAVFRVLTCEAELPAKLVYGTARVTVGGRELPLPRTDVNTIVIVGDTGCRMKQPGNFFQDCEHASTWPLEQIAQRAAALKPDLVVHVGDYHYRESPCPDDRPGCANGPWGYGYDAWDADFFRPARVLLAAAPWVYVRGNHESCFRAGQGWFRFLAQEPWTAQRSCDDPRADADADYSAPYAVPLGLGGRADTQLIVFDSSHASDRAYDAGNPGYRKYFEELQAVDRLVQQVLHSIFLSHHPVLAFAPVRSGVSIVAAPGNAGLQSVMSAIHPGRLFAPGIDLAMHGHVHLFEAVSFSSGQPATLVLGNSGSYRDFALPSPLPHGAEPAAGAVVQEFASNREFGFASLQRQGADWLLTERDVEGRAVMRCTLHGAVCHCVPADGGP